MVKKAKRVDDSPICPIERLRFDGVPHRRDVDLGCLNCISVMICWDDDWTWNKRCQDSHKIKLELFVDELFAISKDAQYLARQIKERYIL